MQKIIDEIKALLSQNSMPVLGITGAASLQTEPLGYRPSDMLASAKSILCFGIPVPKGIFKCQERSEWMYWRAANIYYRTMDAASMKACSVIEARGEIAVPIYGCFPYDIKGKGDFRGYLSLVRMGEATGIGKIGKNGLLFHSQYGPRLLLGGIVTTAELPQITWPETNVKGCPEDCFFCQEQCPVKAIGRSGKVDRMGCTKYSSRSPIFSDFMKTSQVESKDIQMMNHLTAVDDHSMYQCIKCVSVCPYS
jgi:epoxyqueuosine reductase QueG